MQHKSSLEKNYTSILKLDEVWVFLLSHNNIIENVSMFAGISNLSGVASSGCGGHGNLSFILDISSRIIFPQDERGSFLDTNLSLSLTASSACLILFKIDLFSLRGTWINVNAVVIVNKVYLLAFFFQVISDKFFCWIFHCKAILLHVRFHGNIREMLQFVGFYKVHNTFAKLLWKPPIQLLCKG